MINVKISIIEDEKSLADILKEACKAAERIHREDPECLMEKHLELKNKLDSYMRNELKKLSL